jgi:hypothetical protein
MRSAVLSAIALSTLLGAPAFAQGAPPGVNPVTGARPGNDVGTGMSMPMGNRASNIDQRDTRSEIAPNLPSPSVGPDASAVDYLRAADRALREGRTGESQQALEMAQTRLLDRSVPQGQTGNSSQNPAVAQIDEALHALAAGQHMQAMQLIDAAIPQVAAMP